ncbi:unnamed protein product [Heligmosomoides polygyrus]|uniref:Ovule protein n=1 Tax=Heligmosomoides polygyrus TaxID=6339 RepID=A0A3P8CLF4_HELPZ|nr:unnamed protein product [Heligmosomoides polygyrus]
MMPMKNRRSPLEGFDDISSMMRSIDGIQKPRFTTKRQTNSSPGGRFEGIRGTHLKSSEGLRKIKDGKYHEVIRILQYEVQRAPTVSSIFYQL